MGMRRRLKRKTNSSRSHQLLALNRIQFPPEWEKREQNSYARITFLKRSIRVIDRPGFPCADGFEGGQSS